jgi:hypothetical protein
MKLRPALAVIPACIALGCAPEEISGKSWFVASEGDTVTVAEAAEIWNAMGVRERAALAESADPAAAFGEALAGKMALELTIAETGAAGDPSLDWTTGSWLRTESATAARKLIADSEIAAVTDSDLEFYRRNEGVQVLFTTETPGPSGPLPLGELPMDLALALESMTPGESLYLDGYGTVTLDSSVSQELEPAQEPDSVVARIIGYGRERYGYLREYESLMRDPDTRVLEDFSLITALPPDSVVISSRAGVWTREQIEREVSFFQTRFPPVQANAQWRDMIVENLLMQSLYRKILENDYPGAADSMALEASGFRTGLAAEKLVADFLDSAVTVTDRDIEEEYLLLPEPVIMAQRRVFETARCGLDELPNLRLAASTGTGMESFAPVEGLADGPAGSRRTRPLMRAELPGASAESLFALEPLDTLSWQGPFEVEPGVFAAFRLVRDIPSRPAAAEDIEDQLRESARVRLGNRALEALLLELRERQGVEISGRALDALPPDPGLWPRENGQ